MQILLIAQEPPLKPDAVVTGNAIRTAQLEGSLRRAGHTVNQTWLEATKQPKIDSFRNRDELQAMIARQHPDVILVAYWELLELLPFELPQPVIVDFIAPRPLENLYGHPEQVSSDLQRLQNNLAKCDLLLTGDEAQRSLLWFTLLQAGFDLRGCEPILVIPLAAEPAGRPESDPEVDGWTLVSGGVDWPWRHSGEYWQAIESMQQTQAFQAPQLVLFGGQYRLHDTTATKESSHQTAPGNQTRELASYTDFSRFLLEFAHIGLEVARPNIERKYSLSFRSLEFLRHGLPLICNDYLPISRLVNQYEAGWTVSGPEDLENLLRNIISQPEEWKRRSENALRLVEEELNPEIVAKPLLDWLELPAKAPQLPAIQQQPVSTALDKQPWPQQLKRLAGLARCAVLSWIIRAKPADNILIVTRRDLFPNDHGAAVKIVETARALSQHGRKVGIVSDDRKHWWLFENGVKQRRRLPFWLRLLSLPREVARLLHFSKDLPRSNSFLYLPLTDSSFFWHCLYVGKKLKVGTLQAEFPAYARPCINAREILNAAVVLVEHNVEYARLKAQVPELTTAQFRNLQAIEINLCNRSDAVICVSDNDRQRLLDDGVNQELLNTIPHGFDPVPYSLPQIDNIRGKFGLPDNAVLMAFHGTFCYSPNRDALQVFAEILLPQLQSADLPFHVIAIGRNPPAENLHPNMHFTGSVDQVGPWLKACDLAVVPLREGGGTRMKIIDCFAAGLPVISTSKGIEGIPVVNQREAIICDDWVEMRDIIIDLAGSPKRRERLSTAGLTFVSAMDWKSITKRYLSIFSMIRRPAK